jgi:D-alanyl-lipoteichoic acid acyltransferase DltB (MBOAT superfamily)
MDVYRGDVEPEKNLFRYALFVSFFPQLVAGPIERSKHLLSQVRECHTFQLWNFERIVDGLGLMLWGYFLKMVVADRLAIFVTKAYDDFMYYGACELIVATIFFAFQIYCDFASYSVIAVGAAKIMGFELMENFDTPYLSRSITEFWRRWHISLSTWFRDYLYFPMGGSRKGTLRTCRNIMVTFLVSGLWHGADWRYIVWGGLHGAYQVVGRMTAGIKKKLYEKCGVRTDNFSFGLMQTVVTFVLVDFAWIFFRADTMQTALLIIRRMFTRWNPWIFFDESIYQVGLSRREFGIALFCIGVLLVHDLLKRFISHDVSAWFKEQGHIFRGMLYIAGIVMILVFGIYGPNFNPPQFVYFQF